MEPTQYHLLPYGRPLNGLFAENALFKLRVYSVAKEPKPGSGMLDDESGIGLDGNTVVQVDKDAPPFKPTIVDDEGNAIEGDPDADGEA